MPDTYERRLARRSDLSRGLGALIRERRTAAGLDQAQLAERLPKTSQARVSDWERGFAVPTLPQALVLADVLGFSLDDVRGLVAAS